MKTLIQFLSVAFCSLLLFSCGNETHFLKEESYRNQVKQDFEQKQAALPNGNLFAVFSNDSLTVSEREALMFLYAYMPIGDITDYSGEYYLKNFRLSEQTRSEMAWGKVISDELFRHFVLPIRVNNENLDDSREVFYSELKDHVKGLSMKDAILEVNHWCHEKVVYRPSDARTSSPLASVKTAFGRCGEESTFTVAALRSVGIPARQVYTPRWAHTDDNHAWVEAWADGQWYFLGACEPEPVLNLGWFNAPASRGMLMHTKVFGRYNGPEEVMSETSNYTEINVIGNYAPTGKAMVTVVDTEGKPVNGAMVQFKVYNYAEFYTVATKYTDAEGKASLTAGLGDMLVWASFNGKFGFDKVSFGKTDNLVLTLDKQEGESYSLDVDIVPPVEGANLPEVTAEQRAENDRRFAYEDSVRNAYVATMPGTNEKAMQAMAALALTDEDKEYMVKYLIPSRGNYQTLLDFVQHTIELGKDAQYSSSAMPLAKGILSVISAKDLRDISLEVLLDHLKNAPNLNSQSFDAKVLARINSPRVSNEMLTPFRAFLLNAVPQTDAEAFKAEPSRLVDWCRKEIKVDNALNPQRIPISPAGVWKARVADEHSRDIFFVAMARTLGIPAWIDEVTGKVQYCPSSDDMNMVFDVNFEENASTQTASGTLRSAYRPIPSLSDPKYYNHFTLSKFDNGTFKLLNYDEGDVDMGGGATWSNLLKNGTRLETGYYMMVTGTRMASGTVLAQINFFNIKEGETTSIDLTMRENSTQVQVIGNFNSESLFAPIEKPGVENLSLLPKQSLLQACGRGYFVVGVLGVGQEPTNHALRDIAALSSELEKWGRKMVLLFPDEAQCKKFQSAEFAGLPSNIMYGIDTDGICDQIMTNMKLDHKSILPVFIVADTFNRVVFVSQGYTIGLGEQLIKTVHGL